MVRARAFARKLKRKPIKELFRAAPKFAHHQLERRVLDAYYWGALHPTSAARTRRRRGAVERLRSADRILFLCHGNVCRSPFAERYARRRLDERGLDGLTVDSAGAVEMNDPRSPENARRTAADYGIDLADHRSVEATAESIAAADLVLVMDYRNYRTYASRHSTATDRMYLLRIFEPGRAMQIDDPHGYDRPVFESVYAKVANCVDALLDEYERVVATRPSSPTSTPDCDASRRRRSSAARS